MAWAPLVVGVLTTALFVGCAGEVIRLWWWRRRRCPRCGGRFRIDAHEDIEVIRCTDPSTTTSIVTCAACGQRTVFDPTTHLGSPREVDDFRALARLQGTNVPWDTPTRARFHLRSPDRSALERARSAAPAAGFTPGEVQACAEERGREASFALTLTAEVTIRLADTVYEASRAAAALAEAAGVEYGGWEVPE